AVQGQKAPVEPEHAEPQDALGHGLSAADVALQDAHVEQRDWRTEDRRALAEAEQRTAEDPGQHETDRAEHERVEEVREQPDPEAGHAPLGDRRLVTGDQRPAAVAADRRVGIDCAAARASLHAEIIAPHPALVEGSVCAAILAQCTMGACVAYCGLFLSRSSFSIRASVVSAPKRLSS